MTTARIAAVYKMIAVIVLNTVVLFLIVNAVSAAVLTFGKQRTRARQASALTDLFPGMSVTDIAELLNESMSFRWRYDPWTQFREAPLRGRFINIHPDGYRLNGAGETPPSGPTVMFFGGSTTFGDGIPDGATIPAQFEKLANSGFRPVRALNYGQRNFWSDQETALLWRLLQNGQRPQVVIFLDGLNEGHREPQYTKQIERIFEFWNSKRSGLLTSYLSDLPFYQVAIRLFPGLMPRRPEELRYGVAEVSQVLARWDANRSVIRALGAHFGFRPVFFIQPIPGYKNNWGKHRFDAEPSAGSIRDAPEKMRGLEEFANRHDTFSLTDLLASYEKQPFVDPVHYSPEVSLLIAQAILRHVAGSLSDSD